MNRIGTAIIGAGIQGITLALRLLEKGIRDFCLIDPEEPLSNWKRMTGRTGMGYLRSPGSHHPGPKHNSLFSYAPIPEKNANSSGQLYYPPYFRPNLQLFNSFCEALIHQNKINDHLVNAKVLSIERANNQTGKEHTGYVLYTNDSAAVYADSVVLAQGWTELNIPYPEIDGRSAHIFSADFTKLKLEKNKRILILGAGLSAVQKALHLAGQGYDVSLASRRELKAHLFDSDPCLIGPKCGIGFKNLAEDVKLRKRFIADHSYPGTVPFDFFYKIRNAIGLKKVGHIIDPELSIIDKTDYFDCHGNSFDILIQATGFKKNHSKLLTDFAQKNEIPLYNSLPDNNLQYFPRLYVMGFSASLRLGGFAPNIIGGRKSAEIIAQAISIGI